MFLSRPKYGISHSIFIPFLSDSQERGSAAPWKSIFFLPDIERLRFKSKTSLYNMYVVMIFSQTFSLPMLTKIKFRIASIMLRIQIRAI